MKIIPLDQIKEIIKNIDIIPAIEQGFVAYSNGNAIIPPVGELLFENPPGDVHIKYGYILNDEYYVVKIASIFKDNWKLQLPSLTGLMLVFSQKSGAISGILLDEGYLTNLRTAAAGAIVAKYLAPRVVHKIGVIGAGTQARLQVLFLKNIIHCKDVLVFGRDEKRLSECKAEMEKNDFHVETTKAIEDITSNCNLIITATPSTEPLLFVDKIKKGTHITAIGADTAQKQELDENIFRLADLVVVDSLKQCVDRGDVSHALRKKVIAEHQVIELGNVIAQKAQRRMSDDQITIADLTGLAVQDIQIAKLVFEATN